MTYAQQIAQRFPICLELTRTAEYVHFVWARSVYLAETIYEFAGVDEDLVVATEGQLSLDIPLEIADYDGHCDTLASHHP